MTNGLFDSLCYCYTTCVLKLSFIVDSGIPKDLLMKKERARIHKKNILASFRQDVVFGMFLILFSTEFGEEEKNGNENFSYNYS